MLLDFDSVRQRPHRAEDAREGDCCRLERLVHRHADLCVGRELRRLRRRGARFAPVGGRGRVKRPWYDPRRVRRVFLSVAHVEPAEHDAVGEHLHQHGAVVLHPLRRAAGKAAAPVLQAADVYGRELALPDRPLVAQRTVRVSGDVDGHRVAVQDAALLRRPALAARGALRRHMGEGEHRLAGMRLLRGRQHRVEPLPVNLSVATVELRDHDIREALDFAFRIRSVRRLDEFLHLGERLGRVLLGVAARMVLVVEGVMPRIDEQLLGTFRRRNTRERLLDHLAVGDVARRIMVVGHVAVVDDQIHADVAEELVCESRTRAACLCLADMRIRHQPDLEERLLLRSPHSRKRRECNRPANERPSCHFHAHTIPNCPPRCQSSAMLTKLFVTKNFVSSRLILRLWKEYNLGHGKPFQLSPVRHRRPIL